VLNVIDSDFGKKKKSTIPSKKLNQTDSLPSKNYCKLSINQIKPTFILGEIKPTFILGEINLLVTPKLTHFKKKKKLNDTPKFVSERIEFQTLQRSTLQGLQSTPSD